MTSYRVVEIFHTLQGEGFHTGRASVFVRFTGCNLWTGHDPHRERDAAVHGAECPRWCDTDFRKGRGYSAEELASAIDITRGGLDVRHIVFTGGEPLLQLDAELVHAVRRVLPFATLAIETNGTVAPKHGVAVDWVCVSPKVPLERLVVRAADELKVVVPDYDPHAYDGFRADHYYVSPRARVLPDSVGRSLLDHVTIDRAARFCMQHPKWRLSLQTHKEVGIP